MIQFVLKVVYISLAVLYL